jgi:hypothetical protein
MRRLGLLLALAACGGDVEAGGSGVDAAVDDDPLAVDDAPDTGSFDELHRRIIAPRCSGTPGLCHNGQFEPNLSTPGLAYAYLVNRPSIEKPTLWRVAPGDAAASVLIDKLRNRDVATQMPLGADPLEEADIAAIEAWIEDGALRRPGDDPAPRLNEPPWKPEIGVFAANGTRLDVSGNASVAVGDTITLRHTVRDFETADADIPFAAMLLNTTDGRSAVLVPAAQDDPHVAQTTYDASGPMGNGDLLDYRFGWTIPSTIELYNDQTGVRTPVGASGLVLYPIAIYLDAPVGGIAALQFSNRPLVIQ